MPRIQWISFFGGAALGGAAVLLALARVSSRHRPHETPERPLSIDVDRPPAPAELGAMPAPEATTPPMHALEGEIDIDPASQRW